MPDDAPGDLATIADLKTLLPGPVPDGLLLLSVAPGRTAGASSRGCTGRALEAGLAGRLHVAGERAAHFVGVLVGQVDLVAGVVEAETVWLRSSTRWMKVF